MKEPVKNIDLEKRIFAASSRDFNSLAIELFHYQYEHNLVYKQYCDLQKTEIHKIDSAHKIPFLPISFFKTHEIKTGEFEPQAIFESSGTTASGNSRHFVKELSLYLKSFMTCFERFYGSPDAKCILALLPSYLERKNSSLVTMMEQLIRAGTEHSGFYLYDNEKLHRTILHSELLKKPTLLIGITWALLDFAEQFPMQLHYTTIIETGGMKGRRREMTREEVHTILHKQLGPGLIHSEYGMTELLSQAYSKGDGIFHSPPWMKVLIRDEDDPLHVFEAKEENPRSVNGVINIIDLANIYSCCFIATDDAGRLHSNGSFEVLGRVDNSDVRGCSLMVI